MDTKEMFQRKKSHTISPNKQNCCQYCVSIGAIFLTMSEVR